MSDLISVGTKIMAERLNLTYQEMEEVEKIYFQIPKEQRTLETLKQLAEGMKSMQANELKGTNNVRLNTSRNGNISKTTKPDFAGSDRSSGEVSGVTRKQGNMGNSGTTSRRNETGQEPTSEQVEETLNPYGVMFLK